MKKKVMYEGCSCAKCGTPVVIKSHDGPTRPNQKYWFRFWFECPKCGALYMVERAKVYVKTGEVGPKMLEAAEYLGEQLMEAEEKKDRVGVVMFTSLLNHVWDRAYKPE